MLKNNRKHDPYYFTRMVDLTDDLVSGILVSRLFHYLLEPEKNYCVRKLQNKFWVVKTRHEWWEDCRIRPTELDAKIKRLEKMGFIESRILFFRKKPTIHIWLNIDLILQMLEREKTRHLRG